MKDASVELVRSEVLLGKYKLWIFLGQMVLLKVFKNSIYFLSYKRIFKILFEKYVIVFVL